MSTLPDAFEACDDGVCPDVKLEKNKGKDTWRVFPDDKPKIMCTAPCGCHLFSAKSGVADGKEEWAWEYEAGNVFKADEKKFKFICVKPVPGGKDKLCATGFCEAPVEKGDTIRCKPADSCKGPCKCVLFRWEKDKREKKWEKVEGFPHKPDDKYLYRCLCIA